MIHNARPTSQGGKFKEALLWSPWFNWMSTLLLENSLRNKERYKTQLTDCLKLFLGALYKFWLPSMGTDFIKGFHKQTVLWLLCPTVMLFFHTLYPTGSLHKELTNFRFNYQLLVHNPKVIKTETSWPYVKFLFADMHMHTYKHLLNTQFYMHWKAKDNICRHLFKLLQAKLRIAYLEKGFQNLSFYYN